VFAGVSSGPLALPLATTSVSAASACSDGDPVVAFGELATLKPAEGSPEEGERRGEISSEARRSSTVSSSSPSSLPISPSAHVTIILLRLQGTFWSENHSPLPFFPFLAACLVILLASHASFSLFFRSPTLHLFSPFK
jgi:hypothetical protein